MADETPEGKSIVELALGCKFHFKQRRTKFIKFPQKQGAVELTLKMYKIRKGASMRSENGCNKQEMEFLIETERKGKRHCEQRRNAPGRESENESTGCDRIAGYH